VVVALEVVPVVVTPVVVPVVEPVVVTPVVVPVVVTPVVVPVVEEPLVVAPPGAEPELPGSLLPPGAPLSQPLCLPGLFWRRLRPLLRSLESSELLVSELFLPLDPIELPDVSALLEPAPIVPEALEPWLTPLDEPIELLPELEPERLAPADPDAPGVEIEPDVPDEPDEPADPAF
jgi:hypothetical protein